MPEEKHITIVITGPRGSGKTQIADALETALTQVKLPHTLHVDVYSHLTTACANDVREVSFTLTPPIGPTVTRRHVFKGVIGI